MAQNFHLDIASDKDEGGRRRRASEGLGKDQKAKVHALLQAFEILLFPMPPVFEGANLGAIFGTMTVCLK